MGQIIKLLLITAAILLLTACGSGSSSNEKIENIQYTLSHIEYENVNYAMGKPYIGRGEKIQLIAKGINDSSDTEDISDMVIWKSLNTDIAIISSNGLLTAVSEGIATITAELNDSSAELTVEVMRPYIYKVKLTPLETTINIGDTFTFVGERVWTTGSVDKLPLCQPSLMYAVWHSNNEDIAHIDCNGTVTGLSKGTIKITVRWMGDQPDLPTPKPGEATLIVK